MSNWCRNYLKVSGDAEEMKRFVKKSMDGYTLKKRSACETQNSKERYFTLNALVPVAQKQLSEEQKEERCQLWGVPDDVETCKITEKDMGWREGAEKVELDFSTRDIPPYKWLLAVSKKFPTLHFELVYAECVNWLYGSLEAQNGVMENFPKEI